MKPGEVIVDGAEVRYRDRRGRDVEALQATTLTFEPGSFTSLVGPSGCGKSTLLNAIAGFVQVSAGSIRIDGRTVAAPAPDVGIVFQQYALFPWFTALGNVCFGLKRLPIGRRERRERALQALEQVGLVDRANAYPAQLSGGMRQRVALARTLAPAPTVLLMDEPFGALDAQTRLSMQELLLGIWDTLRTTVIFVTHDVDEALILSDRAQIMSAGPGRIIATIEIPATRPRSSLHVDSTYLSQRNQIMQLLRARQTE